MKLQANYHTHTFRCHHAYGCEWEYIERAIAGGLKILGFSDHNPWQKNEVWPKVRMKIEELDAYVETIEHLKKIYGDRITLRIGLEVEYLPDLFDEFLAKIKENGKIEYLILGQHFHAEEGYPASGKPFKEKQRLTRWVDNMIEAFHTGKFLYVAHPDVVNFKGSPLFYKKEMRRLCRAANECGLPLEINGQGYRAGFIYPNKRFWKIAGKMGCKAVIGMDAHRPSAICDWEEMDQLLKIAKRYHLKVLDELEIKGLFE